MCSIIVFCTVDKYMIGQVWQCRYKDRKTWLPFANFKKKMAK